MLPTWESFEEKSRMADGRIVLVTGATDGIGLRTALDIARTGARLVVHGRSPARVDKARKTIEEAGGRAEGITFDFASLASVRQGAEELARRFPRLDVLVNNAGVYMNERVVTEDGQETTFQVNHLGPFLLTNLLLKGTLTGPGARIINVSSIAHSRGRMSFEDPQLARGFSPYGAYAQSKLANILFTFELAERLPAEQATVNCLHPGVVSTKLLTEGFGMQGNDTVEEAAATSVYLATSPEVEGVTGRYFVRQREASPAPQAQDTGARRRLWELSEQLCSLR
ncbi:SDR family oxidoreductase [Hyalangium rubrum]|uniref:SDR family oxidoreductase n=1 Tax=Hyalangium rubrum TaxID=3103134 RepID=A0ABU5GYI6_9BACT|nr:SDR family oxidoreductase [Hyalangium sp. s54d21]MDY7226262.1 SDR family oxidoreductase [Hyalangium sp. s54d21]